MSDLGENPTLRDAIAISRDLLESLVDEDDCWFDHHGGCQAHMYLSLKPSEVCPQQQIKDLLVAAATFETRDDARNATIRDNDIAAALLEAWGCHIPLSVRYRAAEAANAVVEEWILARELVVPSPQPDAEELRIANERGDAWRSIVKEDTLELERLRALLNEILATFTRKGSIGSVDNVLRSDWQDVSRVEAWRAAVFTPNETDQ